ncbi:MAG: acyl carrier protein [Myxococcales bacterium]|nr:acyl carrier protein [Myxococcales bacterium]
MSDNRDKLRATFREALGLPAEAPVDELAYRAVKEWDSVAHMQLVASIESAFELMLDTDDVIGMSSFAAACAIVGKHGVAL